MFRASTCLLRRKLNAYSYFMIQTKNHPDLVGLPIAKRGKKLAAMYKALPAEQLAKLKARASK